MSDVSEDDYSQRLDRMSDRTSSMEDAERAALVGVEVAGNAFESAANAGGSRDDDWQHVEHPSAEADQCQAAEQGEEGGNKTHNVTTVPETDAALEAASLEDSISESAESSQHSGHSFEHLSDHFGEEAASNSLTTSSRSSLDGLLVHSSSFGSSLDSLLMSPSEVEPLIPSARTLDALATPTAPFADNVQLPALLDAGTEETMVNNAEGEVAPAVAGEVEPPASEVPDAEEMAGGLASPVGSSYVNLQAVLSEEERADGEPPSFAAGSESDVEATELDGLPIEDWDSEDEDSDRIDGMSAVWNNDEDGAKPITWMDTLRAAMATLVPTAAIATVLAWIENWRENLRALEMPTFGRLPVRLLCMNRSTLVLGVGGITIAVLSGILYNSRQQNQRLRASLYERDQDIAWMVARIFQLREATQPRRIPIIHHVSYKGFSAFPALPTLAFM